MKKSTKNAIANKRKITLLIAICAILAFSTLIFVILWVKQSLSNKSSQTPKYTPAGPEPEKIIINNETLKADFWHTLYMKADNTILSRTNTNTNQFISDYLSYNNSVNPEIKTKVDGFLSILQQYQFNVEEKETKINHSKPFEYYIDLLKTLGHLFTHLNDYIKNIEVSPNSTETFGKQFGFEKKEFELIYLVLIKIYTFDLLKVKGFVFNKLRENKLLGEIDLNEEELNVYKTIGLLYVSEIDELAKPAQILKLVLQEDKSGNYILLKKNEFESILLFLSFNIHFILFWEIRIGPDGSLSVYQDALKPKFKDDGVKQAIKSLFVDISKNLDDIHNNKHGFITNTYKLLQIVIKAWEKNK